MTTPKPTPIQVAKPTKAAQATNMHWHLISRYRGGLR